MIIYI